MLEHAKCYASLDGVLLESETVSARTREEASALAMSSLMFKIDPLTPSWLLSAELQRRSLSEEVERNSTLTG